MLVEDQMIKMRWNSRNKKYYLSFGCYTFTKMKDEFLVHISHLKHGSAEFVWVKCDYCNRKFQRTYSSHILLHKRQDEHNGKDCCENKQCVNEKIIETNNIKYGVDYAKQNPDVQRILEDRLEEKYGVRNVFQLPEIIEKSQSTTFERYGHTNYHQSEEGKERMKRFYLDKYGVENPFAVPEIIEKIKNTMVERYGVEYLMQDEDIKNERMLKRAQTVYKFGGVSTSRQQIYLSNLLNAELNYPEGRINMDFAFPNEKIYVEYHGSGHWLSCEIGGMSREEFDLKESKRQYFLKSKGWKLIRIISYEKDMLPSDYMVKKLISRCKNILNSGRSWVEINIDESRLEYKGHIEKLQLGDLRIITEEILQNQEVS